MRPSVRGSEITELTTASSLPSSLLPLSSPAPGLHCPTISHSVFRSLLLSSLYYLSYSSSSSSWFCSFVLPFYHDEAEVCFPWKENTTGQTTEYNIKLMDVKPRDNFSYFLNNSYSYAILSYREFSSEDTGN